MNKFRLIHKQHAVIVYIVIHIVSNLWITRAPTIGRVAPLS